MNPLTMKLQFRSAIIKRLLIKLTLLLPLVTSSHLQAWGPNGHRIVADIADKQLSASAKQQVLHITQGQSLALISTWPDEMRSNPSPFWQQQSSKWHYINIDNIESFKTTSFSAKSHKEDVKDAYTALLTAIAALQDPTTKASEQRFYLSFLVHIVGDIHQPMHVGRSADRGGNKIDISFFSQQTNLHRLWDSGLIEQQQLSYTEYSDFLCCRAAQNLEAIATTNIKAWLLESRNVAAHVYAQSPAKAHYNYVYEFKPVWEKQLLRAGVRLGALLNAIFDGEQA